MSAIITSANSTFSRADNANFRPNAMTVEGWFKANADPSDYAVLATLNNDNWILYWSANSGADNRKPRIIWRNTTPTAFDIKDTTTRASGTWFHLAFTANGTDLKLYVNGTEVATTAASGTTKATSNTLYVGSDNSGFRNVSVSDLRIWNVARTQVQIAANYQTRLAGNETNLVAYWKFNDGAGNTADDLTSNALDLTATSASWSTDEPAVFAQTTGAAFLLNFI